MGSLAAYDLLDRIGEGSYGTVYKAVHKKTKSIVAIKKFKYDDTGDQQQQKKTALREVATLRVLNANGGHENIIRMREAFTRKKKLYLVFDYADDGNLLEVLERSPNGLDPELVKKLIYQLLKALAYCHANSIYHRDIKPENLLIQRVSGIVRLLLCDFGFARFVRKEESNELTDYVATRWYRSPELLLGTSAYNSAVDVFAVPCIMAELYNGQPLFPGADELDQLHLIQKSLGPLPPEQINLFFKNPRFLGHKIAPTNEKPSPENTLEHRYAGIIPPEGIDFMHAALCLDPQRRITAKQALLHPFFASCRAAECQPTLKAAISTASESYDDDFYSDTLPANSQLDSKETETSVNAAPSISSSHADKPSFKSSNDSDQNFPGISNPLKRSDSQLSSGKILSTVTLSYDSTEPSQADTFSTENNASLEHAHHRMKKQRAGQRHSHDKADFKRAGVTDQLNNISSKPSGAVQYSAPVPNRRSGHLESIARLHMLDLGHQFQQQQLSAHQPLKHISLHHNPYAHSPSVLQPKRSSTLLKKSDFMPATKHSGVSSFLSRYANELPSISTGSGAYSRNLSPRLRNSQSTHKFSSISDSLRSDHQHVGLIGKYAKSPYAAAQFHSTLLNRKAVQNTSKRSTQMQVSELPQQQQPYHLRSLATRTKINVNVAQNYVLPRIHPLQAAKI